MRILILLALCSISAFAASRQAELNFWYEKPCFPGDGNSVKNRGRLSFYDIYADTASIVIAFDYQSPKFKKLGGWMREIKRITGTVKLISTENMINDSYFGSADGQVTLQLTSGMRMEQVNCLQTIREKSEERQRRIDCYIDNTDSFSFYLPLNGED